jgi:hypothetical protein
MATQGLRANNSEYLRSVLDDGEPYRYDDGCPGINFTYNDVDMIFVDYKDEFQLVIVDDRYTDMYDNYLASVRFSYDRSDGDIEMFFVYSTDENVYDRIIPIKNGGYLSLGTTDNETYDAGSIDLAANRNREYICNDLIWMFDNVESYINKITQVIDRLDAESDEFNKDRFIELMTERRCKSARK